MLHHVVLYKLKPEVTPARVEEMMMNSRMQLLKIPEVLSIKCGKRIHSNMAWPFFIALDFVPHRAELLILSRLILLRF